MIMVFGQESIEEELEIGGRNIDNDTEFVYLGSLLTLDNDCNKEIKRRIARTIGAMGGFKTSSSSSSTNFITTLLVSGRLQGRC